MENGHIQLFPKGHDLYPEGAVFKTDFDLLDEGGNPTVTEYTLEEWQDLQNTQSSQSS